MEFNQFLFPAPRPSYASSTYLGDLIYVPRYDRDQNTNNLKQFCPQDHPRCQVPFEYANPNKPGPTLSPSKKPNNDLLSNNHLQSIGSPMSSERGKNLVGLADDLDPATKLQQAKKLNQLRKKTGVAAPQESTLKAGEYIPCLYLPHSSATSQKLLIYFHANAEDIGLATELLNFVREMLKVNVLAMEYPGYGIQKGEPDADQIAQDALNVYDYLTIVLGVKEENIILFGRSIGSGAASFLAGRRKPCALLLMSPFKNIREIIKEQAGSVLQYLVRDRFRNIDEMPKIQCPTFFVHGQQDQLIPFSHSQEMCLRCGGPSSIILPRLMDHNEFDFMEDLIHPFYNFLKQMDIKLASADAQANAHPKFPEQIYLPPQDQLLKERLNSRNNSRGSIKVRQYFLNLQKLDKSREILIIFR